MLSRPFKSIIEGGISLASIAIAKQLTTEIGTSNALARIKSFRGTLQKELMSFLRAASNCFSQYKSHPKNNNTHPTPSRVWYIPLITCVVSIGSYLNINISNYSKYIIGFINDYILLESFLMLQQQ